MTGITKLLKLNKYLRQHKLRRDTLFGLTTTFLRGLATIAVSFIVVRALGTENLGLWSLILLFTTQGYLGLIDMGLHGPVTREISAAENNDNVAAADYLLAWYRRRLTTHLLVISPIVILAYIFLQPESLRTSLANQLVLLSSLIVALITDTLLLPYLAMLEGRSRFISVRSIELLQRLLNLGFVLLIVTKNPTVESMVYSYAASSAATLATASFVSRSSHRRSIFAYSQITREGDDDKSRQFGTPKRSQIISSFAARIATTFHWQIGRTLCLLVLGYVAAGGLEILTRYGAVVVLLSGGLTGALLPRFVESIDSERPSFDTLSVVLRWFLVIKLPAVVFFWIHAERVVEVWFGQGHSNLIFPIRIALLSYFLNGIGGVFDLFLISLNRNDLFALSRWISVVLTAITSYPFMVYLDLTGLALALLISAFVALISSFSFARKASNIEGNFPLGRSLVAPLVSLVGALFSSSLARLIFQGFSGFSTLIPIAGFSFLGPYLLVILFRRNQNGLSSQDS